MEFAEKSLSRFEAEFCVSGKRRSYIVDRQPLSVSYAQRQEMLLRKLPAMWAKMEECAQKRSLVSSYKVLSSLETALDLMH